MFPEKKSRGNAPKGLIWLVILAVVGGVALRARRSNGCYPQVPVPVLQDFPGAQSSLLSQGPAPQAAFAQA